MSVTKIAARRHATTTGYGVIPIRKRVTMWLCFPRITLPISPPFHHPRSMYEVLLTGDAEGIAQVDADLQCSFLMCCTMAHIYHLVSVTPRLLETWFLDHMLEVVGQSFALRELSNCGITLLITRFRQGIIRVCVIDGYTW